MSSVRLKNACSLESDTSVTDQCSDSSRLKTACSVDSKTGVSNWCIESQKPPQLNGCTHYPGSSGCRFNMPTPCCQHHARSLPFSRDVNNIACDESTNNRPRIIISTDSLEDPCGLRRKLGGNSNPNLGKDPSSSTIMTGKQSATNGLGKDTSHLFYTCMTSPCRKSPQSPTTSPCRPCLHFPVCEPPPMYCNRCLGFLTAPSNNRPPSGDFFRCPAQERVCLPCVYCPYCPYCVPCSPLPAKCEPCPVPCFPCSDPCPPTEPNCPCCGKPFSDEQDLETRENNEPEISLSPKKEAKKTKEKNVRANNTKTGKIIIKINSGSKVKESPSLDKMADKKLNKVASDVVELEIEKVKREFHVPSNDPSNDRKQELLQKPSGSQRRIII